MEVKPGDYRSNSYPSWVYAAMLCGYLNTGEDRGFPSMDRSRPERLTLGLYHHGQMLAHRMGFISWYVEAYRSEVATGDPTWVDYVRVAGWMQEHGYIRQDGNGRWMHTWQEKEGFRDWMRRKDERPRQGTRINSMLPNPYIMSDMMPTMRVGRRVTRRWIAEAYHTHWLFRQFRIGSWMDGVLEATGWGVGGDALLPDMKAWVYGMRRLGDAR